MRRALLTSRLRFFTGWLAMGIACGAGETSPGSQQIESTSPPLVVAVNAPLASMARRLGGEAIEVWMPAAPGADPADWSPDPDTAARIQSADLVLDQGAGYAAWTGRITLRRERLVDTTRAIRDRMLPVEHSVSHQHGPGGEHRHAGLATATWLDPTLAGAQAEAVAAALAALLPERRVAIESALATLSEQLDGVDARLSAVAKGLHGQPLIFSHPVYPYLIQRYGLDGVSLHWEPDEAPAPSEWRSLEARLRRRPARILFWEAEPLPATRERLLRIGIESRVLPPCGGTPPDLLECLDGIAAALDAAGRASGE